MRYILYIITSVFLLGGCGPSGQKDAGKEEATTAVTSDEETFKSIPQDMIMKIWNEADLLDYIFHNLPFSMSQDEQPSIRANVSYISQQAQPVIPPDCAPIARQFYGSQGNIFLEADIYFSESCRFYVFYVDGEPRYANKMSDEGVQFFNAMIGQALKASESVQ